jgi:hypothetical protein
LLDTNTPIVIHRRSSRIPILQLPATWTQANGARAGGGKPRLSGVLADEQSSNRVSSTPGPIDQPSLGIAQAISSQNAASSMIPLKFLLTPSAREAHTFDSPTRVWNGNLWGPKNKTGTPNMARRSNYSPRLRPNNGDKYICTISENESQTIVWDGSRNCWRLEVAGSADASHDSGAPRVDDVARLAFTSSEAEKVRNILKKGNLKPTEEQKRIELKSFLYQRICTDVLGPLEKKYFKRVSQNKASGKEREREGDEEGGAVSGDDKYRSNLVENLKSLIYFKSVTTVETGNSKSEFLESIVDVMIELRLKAASTQIYSNCNDEQVIAFVDELMVEADSAEKNKKRILQKFESAFLQPHSEVAMGNFMGQRIECLELLPKFRSKMSLNGNIAKTDKPRTVAATPFCLWTALFEAMVDAEVPILSDDPDKFKLKDQWENKKVKEKCLGYMMLDKVQDKTLGKEQKLPSKKEMPQKYFKDEFVQSTFLLHGKEFKIREFVEVSLACSFC